MVVAQLSKLERWLGIDFRGGIIGRPWQNCLIRLPALDAACSATFFEELRPVTFPGEQRFSNLVKRASRAVGGSNLSWWPIALVSVGMAALCAIPFSIIMVGSTAGTFVLFSFALHLTVVVMYLPRFELLLLRRRTPWRFLCAAALLWCLSILLKYAAYQRLPLPACFFLHASLRTPLGAAMQHLALGAEYSSAQWTGIGLLSLGAALAIDSVRLSNTGAILGLLALLGSAISSLLEGFIMKVVCVRFGGNIQEHVFFTHCCALLTVFPSQWKTLRPLLAYCLGKRDTWLSVSLVFGVLLHFAARSTAAYTARSAPNLLTAQLSQAAGHAVQVLIAAFWAAGTPSGSLTAEFWLGAAVALIGTLYFFRASDAPKHQDDAELLPLGLLSPGLQAIWAVATTEAKTGNELALRRENRAWRKLRMQRQKQQAGSQASAMRRQQSCGPHFFDQGAAVALEDLCSVRKEEQRLPCLMHRAISVTRIPPDPELDGGSFATIAGLSILAGSCCVVPYAMLLQADPGSPLCFNFVLHVVILLMYLPHVSTVIWSRKIPLRHHAAIAALWCIFTVLKSDAFTKLPTAVCMLLSNTRMLVGLGIQFTFFGKRYSCEQVLGAAIVTIGIAWAGNAMQQVAASKSSGAAAATTGAEKFAIGVGEVLASTFALALQGSIIKVTFARFGEHVEEQVFITHLCALFVVFPSQWHKVGSRLAGWVVQPDPWLLASLSASVALNFIMRSFATRLAGRAPNLLLVQLVQTVDGFLQLLIAALMRVPPWPPSGFWGGALVLVLGTLQYLRASGAPEEQAQSAREASTSDKLVEELFGSDDDAGNSEASQKVLRSSWAAATVAAKQQGGGPEGSSVHAARRENMAWRKMHKDKAADAKRA